MTSKRQQSTDQQLKGGVGNQAIKSFRHNGAIKWNFRQSLFRVYLPSGPQLWIPRAVAQSLLPVGQYTAGGNKML